MKEITYKTFLMFCMIFVLNTLCHFNNSLYLCFEKGYSGGMETLPILKQLLEAYPKEGAKLDILIEHSIHRSVNDNLLQFSDNVYKDTDATSGLSPVRISKSIENGDYTSMGAVDIGKGMYRCTNPKQEIAEVLKNILLQDSELKEFVNKLFSRVDAVNGYLNFYVSDFVIGNKVSSLLRNKKIRFVVL